MSEDIFESIADLEKRADEVVERAKQQAREFREEVDRLLKAEADRLEREGKKERKEIERELAKRREEMFRKFEECMRAGRQKLETVRREKVAPLVEHVIKAFLERSHGD